MGAMGSCVGAPMLCYILRQHGLAAKYVAPQSSMQTVNHSPELLDIMKCFQMTFIEAETLTSGVNVK